MSEWRQVDVMRKLVLGMLVASWCSSCVSENRSDASNILATCDFLKVPELPFEAAGMHASGNDEQHGCLVNGTSATEQAAIGIRRYENADAAANFAKAHPQGEPFSFTMGDSAAFAVAVHDSRVITVQLQYPTRDVQALAQAIAKRAVESM